MRLATFYRFSLLLLSVLLTPGARAQTWLSAVGAGTGTVDFNSDYIVMQQSVTDAAGNVYFTGYYQGTAQFGATTLTTSMARGLNAFVAKLSPAGVWLWATGTQPTSGAGFGSCRAKGLALAPSGDIVLTGSFDRDTHFGPTTLLSPNILFSNNAFVAQLSATGAWRWATSATPPRHPTGSSLAAIGSATGVAVAPTGEVVVTGFFRDTLTFGSTVLTTTGRILEAFVARLSATGTWQWAVATTGSTGTGVGSSYLYTRGQLVSTDGAGNALVTGSFARAITFGATTLTRADTTGLDLYVARISATGAWQWATRTDHRAYPFDLTLYAQLVDGAGNLLLAGGFDDTVAFGTTVLTPPPNGGRTFVASVGPLGAWRWATGSDGGGSAQVSDGGVALTLDAGGNVLVAGYAYTRGGLNAAMPFVAKLSSTGAWGWRATGSVNSPHDYAIGLGLGFTPAGDVQVAGVFKGTTTLGTTSITSPDSGSVFIATLTNGPLATPGLLATAPPLSVWPNPAHQTATIRTQADELVEVLDAQGRVVRACPRGAAGVTADRLLDVRGLAPGLYLVRAGAATRRLVVE